MKCQPADIRFAVIALKRGVPTVIAKGFATREEANARRPDRGLSEAVGYISTHRRHYDQDLAVTKRTVLNVSPD